MCLVKKNAEMFLIVKKFKALPKRKNEKNNNEIKI